MKSKYKIEKIIVVLLIVKLSAAAMILLAQGKNIAFSFGAPVYAMDKEDTADKKNTEKKTAGKKTVSDQINMEILKSIEQKESDLEARENDLKKKEEKLTFLSSEIDKKLAEIKKVQSNIERLALVREDLIEKSIKHLVKVYSSMKPDEAGPLIEKLDKDITIQILSKMKGKVAGKILARVKPEIATKLSEAIAKRK